MTVGTRPRTVKKKTVDSVLGRTEVRIGPEPAAMWRVSGRATAGRAPSRSADTTMRGTKETIERLKQRTQDGVYVRHSTWGSDLAALQYPFSYHSPKLSEVSRRTTVKTWRKPSERLHRGAGVALGTRGARASFSHTGSAARAPGGGLVAYVSRIQTRAVWRCRWEHNHSRDVQTRECATGVSQRFILDSCVKKSISRERSWVSPQPEHS